MNGEERSGGAESLEEKKERVLAELEAKRAAIDERKRAVQERRRIGRIIGIIIAVLLALAISIYGIKNLRARHLTTAVPAGIAWGETVDGLQAGTEFKSAMAEPVATVSLALHLRNAGNQPVRLLRLGRAKGQWPPFPLVVRSRGRVLRYVGPVLEPRPPPAIYEFIYLAPGEIDTTVVRIGAADWGLSPPFEADVTFVFRNESVEGRAFPYDPAAKDYTKVTGLWTGEARSGTVTVKIE